MHELQAGPGWRTVDLVSDLHLHAGDRATLEAFRGYLQTAPADALIILGDLFELWVGDDAADQPGSFEAECAALLQVAAARRPTWFMHGNRDFLVGQAFLARCGITLLPDPTVLQLHDRRYLLTHGDQLCLADTDYLAYRAQVRTDAWQQAVLARPLADRRALGRDMRRESEMRKGGRDALWADVDHAAARQWLAAANARALIHGHTHRPAEHDLGDGCTRTVLSDWDATAAVPRAQVLCLSAAGARRIDLR